MRKRSEPHTFEQRLAEQRLRLEAEAAKLPHGAARDVIKKKIEQLQLAVEMNRWLSCAGTADSSDSRTSARTAASREATAAVSAIGGITIPVWQAET